MALQVLRLLVFFAVVAMSVACSVTRPSQLDFSPDHMVIVKSSTLPDSEGFPVNLAHHTFFDVKDGSDERWYRCEVNGDDPLYDSIDLSSAAHDWRFLGEEVQVLDVFHGERAQAIISQLKPVSDTYKEEYSAWPGSNSNTFAAYLCHNIPELDVELHHNAVGKDYTGIVRIGGTTTGSGVELETALLGVQLGLEEGVELHFLQLTFGISLFPPAIKLPFLPRIGFENGPPSSALAENANAQGDTAAEVPEK